MEQRRQTGRRRARRSGVSLAVAVAVVAATASPALGGAATSPVEAVRGHLGVVTAESPLASEAGLKVLRQGGNAVDAAVAAAFAIGVVGFHTCGIGGGGFMVYRGADGTTDTLDFFERAPGKGTTYTDRPGMGVPGTPTTEDVPSSTRGVPYAFDTGRGRVGVPGFVKGMEAALARYGTTTLAQAVDPAARYAEDGFPVSPSIAHWTTTNYFHAVEFPATYEAYYKPAFGLPQEQLREPYGRGNTMRLPDYAATLRRIGQNGAAEFYDVDAGHRTATDLLAAMQAPAPPVGHEGDASDMTAEDLRSYQVHWRQPVTTQYRGHTVIGMGGPSAAGTLIAETLNILEGFDLAAMGARSDRRMHLTVEAQRIAWTDRLAYYGDPGPPGTRSDPDDQWADVPRELTTQRYADQRRLEIRESRAASYEPGSFDRPATGKGGAEDARTHTTAVSVIDGEGNAVVINCSLGLAMGSLVTVPGLGFLLNCTLGPWDEPGGANAPAAGKAPRSAQAPTIVVRDDVPVLAIGGQGGKSIPMGVLNVVLQTVDFGQSLAGAMDAPRIDCCGQDRRDAANGDVHLEQRPGMEEAVTALRGRGHVVVAENGYWKQPVLQATATEAGTAEPLLSSSDPRGECGPSSVDKGVTSSSCYAAARADWLTWEPGEQ